MTFDETNSLLPYSLDKTQKSEILTQRLNELTELHINRCPQYAKMMKSIGYKGNADSYKDIPFLPVRLFKELNLKSLDDDKIVKMMTSSGTSGQKTSKIYLDTVTSSNQQKAMVKIVSDYTGSARMPMIILDCPSVLKNRNSFSARGAGILGFSIFGSKRIYALNDDMKLDVAGLKAFIEANSEKCILLFGFTFMVWQHFYKELVRLKEEGITFDLSNGILIHGGGWKKLVNEAVTPQEFKSSLLDVCGMNRVHDYYGMVEQTGCIYMECECGHLHASNYSDVIVRNHMDFSECSIGEKGIIQVVSTIPESYPGHSLLTEDEGIILGEDDCPCGRKGKYFAILGRLKDAEIRGCSDTYGADFNSVKKDVPNLVIIENVNKELSKVRVLVGSKSPWENICSEHVLKPFDDMVIDFLDELSKKMMKNPEAKRYPDIMTLGFWIRRASVEKMKDEYLDGRLRLGRGIAFHIAPSNVPVNYAYSLFTGLLCGNINIVRIPSKDFIQVGIINAIINETLAEYPEIKPYITLIRYERNKDINDYLSSICDVRIIWGGDETVAEIRKSELRPRACDITFADRYSLSVIDTDAFMETDNKKRVVNDFYADTYVTDQNACTSPRVVVWTGKQMKEARNLFWDELHKLCVEKYKIDPITSVNKLYEQYRVSALYAGNTCIIPCNDNLLYRIEVGTLSKELMDYRGNCGYFYEYECSDVNQLEDILDNERCQTIGCYGSAEILLPLVSKGIKGVDRIVPIGHTMDFDLVWDGINLVDQLTRIVSQK